ncbi:MAG: hypothetical protein ACRENL_06205 [Candidatus Dormibacteria bacterium]
MSRTTITGPGGTVTIERRGCAHGCGTVFLVVVVLFGPAAWFPLPLAVAAYICLGLIAGAAAVRSLRRRTVPPPQPPPLAPPGFTQ